MLGEGHSPSLIMPLFLFTIKVWFTDLCFEPFRTQVCQPKRNYEPTQTLQKSQIPNPQTGFDPTLLAMPTNYKTKYSLWGQHHQSYSPKVAFLNSKPTLMCKDNGIRHNNFASVWRSQASSFGRKVESAKWCTHLEISALYSLCVPEWLHFKLKGYKIINFEFVFPS